MPVKVFVVDDSAVVRQTVMHILQGDPDIELAGSAPNPLIAAPLIRKSHPDVLLLDIEMPGMDGLTVFRQQMIESPIPTVICSTLTSSGSKVALDALAAGAVAVVGKPQLGLRQFLEDSRAELLQALKSAARTRPRAPSLTCASAIRPAVSSHCRSATSVVHAFAMNKPVVLGSSTGGTQAIESVLMRLPADSPGIAIVQHMPEKFTAMYAQRLDQICAMSVREARDGDRLERGVVLIAPGGRHMQLRKTGRTVFRVDRRWAAREPAQAVGGSALPLGGGMRRQGRPHHRAGRTDLRRLRHAQGIDTAWCRRRHCADRSRRGEHPAIRCASLKPSDRRQGDRRRGHIAPRYAKYQGSTLKTLARPSPLRKIKRRGWSCADSGGTTSSASGRRTTTTETAMKPETQIHLADLRELLVRHVETWRTVLVAAHARHKSSSAMAEASPLSPAGQQAVDANEAQMRIALDELWLCEAAVSRLGCGSYGDCRDCGQGVDLLRLLVKPHARVLRGL